MSELSEYFLWDSANIAHIALHQVLPAEAEEVLASPTMLVDQRVVDDEFRTAELGCTLRGRLLVVAWVERGNQIRVVTAYTPPRTLKQKWIRLQRGIQ